MHPIFIVLIILLAISIIFLSTCYVCFWITFYTGKGTQVAKEEDLPPGEEFLPYKERLEGWIESEKALTKEEIFIKSYDGLTLRGLYYPFFENAPLEILFHGYRGNSLRDLRGGLERCQRLGRNALLVDMRGHGKSQGKVLTFGAKERLDVKAWAEYAHNRFGNNSQIILTGISMGASSVLLASNLQLPTSVCGIVADCGYSNAKEAVKLFIKKIKIAPWLAYPFVKIGGVIFGGVNIDKINVAKALKESKLPIVFLHGDKDDFVPYEMSVQNYQSCVSPKQLVTFEGAGHGMAYLADDQKYINALKEFEQKHYARP